MNRRLKIFFKSVINDGLINDNMIPSVAENLLNLFQYS